MEDRIQFEQRVAELVRRLPPMPENICRLLQTANGQADEKAIAESIKQDPGLCADLLHLANTFCRTTGHNIDTVDQAVSEVGVLPLIQLVGVWYANNAIPVEFNSLEYLDEYFDHSKDISLGSRILAQKCGMQDDLREMYTVAGLIHDIGRLVILLAANKMTSRLIGTPWQTMKTVVHDEKEVLGMDHCEVGMMICRNWEFSPFMQEMVLRHHSPLIGKDFSLAGAVIFVTHFITCSDFTGEILAEMLPTELLELMRITLDDLHSAREEFKAVKESMN